MNFKKIHTALIYSLFCLVTVGCASGVLSPGADTGPIDAAKSFTPPPGKCGIYVIRESNLVGAAAFWRVFLDVEPLGEVGNNSYLYAAVSPGIHNLQVIYQTKGGMTVQTEAGKNYFYLMHVSWTGNVTPMTEQEGMDRVRRFKGR